jgi:hypothetical protein
MFNFVDNIIASVRGSDEGFDLATTPGCNAGNPLSHHVDDDEVIKNDHDNIDLFDISSIDADIKIDLSEYEVDDTVSNEHINTFIQSDLYRDLRRSSHEQEEG